MGIPGKRFLSVIIIFSVVAALSGCGGGGGASSGGGDSTPLPAKTLHWQAPTAYIDNSSLDPSSDLDLFEIYIREDGNFTFADIAMAALGATVPGNSEVTTSFNLANLGPFLSRDITYYVSIRAVAKNGLKSDFASPATFSF